MKPEQALTLNPLLSERVRLAIMAALAGNTDPVDFNSMLEILNLTKGNFAGHVRKLEEGGLVNVLKDFVDRKPRTRYLITEKGRAELSSYLEQVERLLAGVRR